MSSPNKEVSAVVSRERRTNHQRLSFWGWGSETLSRRLAASPVGRSLHVLSVALLLGAVLLVGLMATTQALANPASATPTATRAPAPGVFNYLDSEPRLLFRSQASGSAQAASTSSATSNTSTQRTVIRVSKLAAQNAVISGRLPVMLSDGTSYDLRVEREELAETGDWTLISRVDTPLGGLAAVITYGRDGVFGVLPKPNGELLQISTSQGETILEPAGGMLPPGQELTPEASKDYVVPPPQPQAATTGFMSDAQAEAIAAEGDVQIDVLGIYTTDLATLRGSASAAETEFTNLLAIANQAYLDSGAVVRLRLVGLRETNYPETVDNGNVLGDLALNLLPDGLDVRQLRDSLAADLVAMLRPFQFGRTSCGVGFLSGSSLSPQSVTSDLGFSVNNVAPCGPYVLAHELGHNLGSNHDIETETSLSGRINRGAYIYSHGYRQMGPPAFATVMAYQLPGQQWIGYFSHPNTMKCLGVACGIAEVMDNVRSLNQMAPRIARFRDPPGKLSILDTNIIESDTGISLLTFTVHLSSPAPAGGVRFDIATANGSATAGADYIAQNDVNQLIPEGQTNLAFNVRVMGDSVVEPNETVVVNISNVTGVTVLNAQAIGTIRNDDPKIRLSGRIRFPAGMPVPTQSLTIDFTIDNNSESTTRSVVATLPNFDYELAITKGSHVTTSIYSTPEPFNPVTISFGTLDSDTVRDIALQTQLKITGRVLFQQGIEPPAESFFISVIIGNSVGNIVVFPPEFRFETRVTSGDPVQLYVQTPPAPYLTSAKIDLGSVTSDTAQDIVLERGVTVSGVVRFPPGMAPPSLPIFVSLRPDDQGQSYTADPPDFRFAATVSPGRRTSLVVQGPPAFAVIAQDLGVLVNDEHVDIEMLRAPELSITDARVIDEQATTANFDVTLSSPVPSGGAWVWLSTANGSATAGSDYIETDQTLFFIEGETSKTLKVPIIADAISESDETFSVNVRAVDGVIPVNRQAMGVILGNEGNAVPSIWVADTSVIEGDAGTRTMIFPVGLSRPAPMGGVSFDIATVDGSTFAGNDFVGRSSSGMTIPAGQTRASFAVTINGDTDVEPDDTFTVAITNVVGATIAAAQATGTIVNDETFITPVANPDRYVVNRNQTLFVDQDQGVLVNDYLPVGATVRATQLTPNPPAHGILSLSEDGAFTYTPNPDYVGEDNFGYSACNSGTCDYAVVSLSIGFTLDPTDRYLWMLPPASNLQQQGFVRLSNRSDSADLVTLWGVDATGRRSSGTVSLTLAPRESRQLNSQDIEQGNLAKGVTGGLGIGTGNWTLVVHSALDLEALAYVRTPDGFLTPIHDRVDGDGVDWFVPMFNPADNPNQVSRLRVINTSLQAVSLQILGVDDAGAVGAGPVAVTVAALSSIELTSADLENGNAGKGLIGKLGNGAGKWHQSVSATGRITLQSLLLDPKGYLTNLSTLPDLTERAPGERTLWLVPPASNVQQQGFVRLINRENRASDVALWGIDDAGQRSSGTVTLRLAPRQSLQLTSQDLEAGNPGKGLTGSLGTGTGNWRLVVLTDLDLLPMGLIRTPDGFLTTVHDTVAGDGLSTRVPMFNPADNPNQVSALRLINPNNVNVNLTIRGVDDAGQASGTVTLTLAANAAVEVTATELEQGNAAKGVTGGLGNRAGKWTLTVTASAPVKVMSLLRDPKGYLTNLSNGTQGTTDQLDP